MEFECAFYWFSEDRGNCLEGGAWWSKPQNINLLTHCPVYQMVFGVVRCFKGLKQTYFLSESEWKWIAFTCREREPWAHGFKVKKHNCVICWNFPIICAYPVRRKCFLMSSQLTSIKGCCNFPTPKNHSASVQLSMKHHRCDKLCQCCVPLFRKTLQQRCKHSFSLIHQAVADVRFDPPSVPP